MEFSSLNLKRPTNYTDALSHTPPSLPPSLPPLPPPQWCVSAMVPSLPSCVPGTSDDFLMMHDHDVQSASEDSGRILDAAGAGMGQSLSR